VVVRLTNDGAQPSLVQAWSDNGDSNATPNESDAPVLVTPPVFRMEPRAGQSLRLTLTNKNELPTDRESVYWLNVLDIPPKPGEDAGNYLQMAIRTRIKIFVRPDNLNLTVDKAAEKLQWTRNAGNKLTIHNPGPYHFSISAVGTGTGKNAKTVDIATMVAPYSSADVTAKSAIPASGNALKVFYINDYGGTSDVTIQQK